MNPVARHGLCLAKEVIDMIIAKEGAQGPPRPVPSNTVTSNTSARSKPSTKSKSK